MRMSSRIILPNGQHVNKENSLLHMKRAVLYLKTLLKERDDTHQARLLSQQRELEKLDKIMGEAFDKIDLFEKKLIELGIDTKELRNESKEIQGK